MGPHSEAEKVAINQNFASCHRLSKVKILSHAASQARNSMCGVGGQGLLSQKCSSGQ